MEDSSGNVYHLMISPNSSFDFVLYVDDYDYVTDDTTSGNSTGDIATEYTTSWFYDDRYVQDKTFVNTVYVVKGVEAETQIRVNAYHDFNSQTVAATHTLTLTPVSTRLSVLRTLIELLWLFLVCHLLGYLLVKHPNQKRQYQKDLSQILRP